MTDQSSIGLSLNLSSSSSSNPFNIFIPKYLRNVLTATILFWKLAAMVNFRWVHEQETKLFVNSQQWRSLLGILLGMVRKPHWGFSEPAAGPVSQGHTTCHDKCLRWSSITRTYHLSWWMSAMVQYHKDVPLVMMNVCDGPVSQESTTCHDECLRWYCENPNADPLINVRVIAWKWSCTALVAISHHRW